MHQISVLEETVQLAQSPSPIPTISWVCSQWSSVQILVTLLNTFSQLICLLTVGILDPLNNYVLFKLFVSHIQESPIRGEYVLILIMTKG